jgi:hypothetical protein
VGSTRGFGGSHGKVVKAMTELAKRLRKADIDYCVIGGNALAAHGYDRATTDVDVLMSPNSRDKFLAENLGRGYRPRFSGAKTKFHDAGQDVPIDIILTGGFPGNGQTEVPFPEPASISFETEVGDSGVPVHFVTLPNLINLKLLCYKDLPVDRAMDFTDVQRLIEINFLDESLAHLLHPSVWELYQQALTIVSRVRATREREEEAERNS